MLDYSCAHCGKDIEDFDDVGYMGEADRSAVSTGDCNPFLDMLCICKACEAKYQADKISPTRIKWIKAMVCTRWHCPSCGDIVEQEGDLRGELRACDCGRKVRLKHDE